jgi:serine/threonine protein phosphatase PrpC
MATVVSYSENDFPKINSKHVDTWENKVFRVTSCSMQGFRKSMEDSHCVELSMKHHPDTAFFGVFDGHSGKGASLWTAKQLPRYIDQLDTWNHETISVACLQADMELESEGYREGTTAVFALVTQTQLQKFKVLIGNIGDSRALFIRNGNALTLTTDHRPEDPEEFQRIRHAGGFVKRSRVLGSLAMARAFGDAKYKQNDQLPRDEQMVIAVPDLTTLEGAPGDYLLLFCDGLVEHDVFDNETVVGFLCKQLAHHNNDMNYALCALLDEAQKRGSKDNITAVLVQFKSAHVVHPHPSISIPGGAIHTSGAGLSSSDDISGSPRM